MTHITRHAVERYQERVEPVEEEQAEAALMSRAVRAAMVFAGSTAQCFVRLATGQRIVVREDTVITVLPAEDYRKKVRRHGRGRYG